MKNFFNKKQNTKNGFAMLFTVLIVSLILSIAIGISNTTLKQGVLSSLAKDSQIAFYQADIALECGIYHDSTLVFGTGQEWTAVPSSISCGENTFSIVPNTDDGYHIYTQSNPDSSKPCSSVIVDTTTGSPTGERIVKGIGYNLCGQSVRQVERALEVRY